MTYVCKIIFCITTFLLRVFEENKVPTKSRVWETIASIRLWALLYPLSK